MPYTRAQIRRILTVNGQPLISPAQDMPLAQRVSESYIRRRLYHIEDRAAVAQFAMLKRANRDIRAYGLDSAQRMSLRKLGVDGSSLAWTRQVNHFMQSRFIDLSRELLTHTLSMAGDSYIYSYYGRAWVLDMSTRRDLRVNMPYPNSARITKAIVQPGLTEDFTPDYTTLSDFSDEWSQRYLDVFDDVTRKMRGQWSLAQVNEESILDGLQRLADKLGTSTDGSKGAAGQVGTLTRSTMQSAATQGTKAIHATNEDYLVGVRFIALPGACRLCEGLDGTQWPLGDPDIVYPVQDTHYNCRCGHLPITASGAEIDSDEPPDLSWTEWLKNNNIQFFADEFAGSALDSEQV